MGEQRRDIIPKTLIAHSLPPSHRIQVDELVVYETGVMESFPTDLNQALRLCGDCAAVTGRGGDGGGEAAHSILPYTSGTSGGGSSETIIIVIFSPSGCYDLLRQLDLLNADGKARLIETSTSASRATNPNPTSSTATSSRSRLGRSEKRYVIATIGPTTYTYLAESFAFKADVCAERPSAEGVGEGLLHFLQRYSNGGGIGDGDGG